MSDNAIDRLKNRQRKKVEPRDPSIKGFAKKDSNTKSKETKNESNTKDIKTKVSQSEKESIKNKLDQEINDAVMLAGIKSLMTKDSDHIDGIIIDDMILAASQPVTEHDLKVELVRKTIRLEPAVDNIMNSLCRENKITRETLIESAILNCLKTQKMRQKVIKDAQVRYSKRKQIGELKKLETLNQKLKKPKG